MAYEEKIIKEVVFTGTETIRDLQDEVKRLRKEVINLDKSSEDYEKTVEDLAQAEYNLKVNMRATKEGVIAAKGSYNDLVDEMAALKRVWRDVTDESERARIGLRIKEINDQLKDLDATLGNHQRKVGSYEEAIKNALLTPQQELRKLRGELANLTRGTEEYNKAFIRMAELTTQMRKQQELLRYSSADLGDILGNLAGVAGSVVGGFSAINAAMALMGDENKDLQQAMLQAQRMIQLVQGLSSLENLGPKIQGLFDGIKNFVKSFQGGAAAVGQFNQEVKEAAGTTEQVTVELATEANAINTNAAATNELTVAKKTLSKYEAETLAITEATIAAKQREIGSLTAEIEMIKARVAAGEELTQQELNQIKYDEVLISKDKSAISHLEQRRAKILEIDAAEKKLNATEKATTGSIAADTKATIANTTAKGASTVATKLLTKAVQGLKIALSAIGIGVIIAGLTALLGLLGKVLKPLWDLITGTKAAKEATDALKKSTEELNRTLEEHSEALDFESRLMEAQGKEYQEVYEYKKQQKEADLSLAKAELAEAEAQAVAIGQKKLAKKKYDDFRETLEDLRGTVKALEKDLVKLDQEKTIHDAQEATNKRKGGGGGGGYDSQLKAAENLYKQLANWYKTDRQLLAQTYEENKRTIEKYIKDKKAKNDALLALEQKYYADLKKLTRDNMDAIYSVYMNQENRKLALMNVWGDKYLERALEVLDEEEKIAISRAAKTVGFEEKTAEQIARMDAVTKKEYLDRKKLFDNERWLLEKEYDRKRNTLVAEQNKRELEAQRAQLQINVENAKSEEELLDAQIALAEFDAYTYVPAMKEATESQEEYNLRIVQAVKALEELQKKQKEIAVESKDWTQLRLDNDATEAGITQGKDSMQYYDARIKAAQYYYDNLKQLQEESNEEFRQRQLEALDELTELERAKLEQRFTNWSNLANGIGDIFGSIADMYQTEIQAQKDADGQYNAQSRKKFDFVKKLQIAQATIQTISGAISAFMSCQSLGFPLGQIIGAVQAAAVTAAGIAQIQQIRKTKLDGSSSSAEGTRYAVAVPSITDYNPQGTVNLTGGSETEDLANAITKNPIKAYVVESDVTAAQEVAAKRQSESTF